jgi:hypothetical protein
MRSASPNVYRQWIPPDQGTGPTPVALSDAGAVAEDLTLAVQIALTDGGSGVDTLTASIGTALTDAGSGQETLAVATAVTLADNGTGTDVLGVVSGGTTPLSLADNGTGTDLLSLVIVDTSVVPIPTESYAYSDGDRSYAYAGAGTMAYSGSMEASWQIGSQPDRTYPGADDSRLTPSDELRCGSSQANLDLLGCGSGQSQTVATVDQSLAAVNDRCEHGIPACRITRRQGTTSPRDSSRTCLDGGAIDHLGTL